MNTTTLPCPPPPPLRQEWSLQALGGAHSLSTQRQCQQVEQAFRDRVMGVAKKAVAKQMSHDLAKMNIEGVSTCLLI